MSQEAMNAKFMEVYERQADTVYRFCCSFMESAIGAESVVQETFLEMVAAKVRFEHEKDERLWLLKRAARLCRDTLREGLAEYGEDAAQSPFSAELLALRELTAEQKLAVYLYYVEGYQMAELSRVLACPTFVIRSRLESAEGKMKASFPEGEAMMRRMVREAYQSAELSPERKERMGAGLLTRLPEVKTGLPWGLILLVALLAGALAVGVWFYFRQDDALQQELPPETQPTIYVEDTAPTVISESEALTIYGPTLDLYRQAIRENWDRIKLESRNLTYMVGFQNSAEVLGFTLIDLDGNQTPELVVSDGTVIYELYTISDGEVVQLLSGSERNSYQLTADNVIVNHAANGAASTIYSFFRLSGKQLVIDRRVFFEEAKDEANPWFKGYSDIDTAEPITEDEASAILDSYARTQIPVTLLIQETAE